MSALVSGCSGSPAYVGEWLAMLFDITCYNSKVPFIEKGTLLQEMRVGAGVTSLFTGVDGTCFKLSQVKQGNFVIA